MKRTAQEMAVIKQSILDFCNQYERTTMEIAKHLGKRPQYIFGYCEHLYSNKFIDRRESVSENGNKCYLFKTLIPTFRKIRINESTESQLERWHFIPVGFMSQQVVEHNVKGRKVSIDDPKRAEILKEADKQRRKEKKQQVTKNNYVSGLTLHMAV